MKMRRQLGVAQRQSGPVAAPTLMGWLGWELRITTPPAAGTAGGGPENTLIVVLPVLDT